MDWTRVPVVVGGGQVTNRDEDPAVAPDPFVLMEDAARRAAADTGAEPTSVLSELTHCFMVHSLSLRHGDPAPELARPERSVPAASCNCPLKLSSVPAAPSRATPASVAKPPYLTGSTPDKPDICRCPPRTKSPAAARPEPASNAATPPEAGGSPNNECARPSTSPTC